MGTQPVCDACRNGEAFERAITMAFQPIVDVSTRTVLAHEALVRGLTGLDIGVALQQRFLFGRLATGPACAPVFPREEPMMPV